MNQNNSGDKSNTCLGNHVWCLGTDVWQLQVKKTEAIKKLLPQNDKLDKIIQIAQILDKYQKEIDYYQVRIRGILEVIAKLEIEKNKKNRWKSM